VTATAPDTLSGPGFYGPGFAEFYDRYGTGWTRAFAPILAEWLAQRPAGRGVPGDRTVLDLACGTGVSAEVLVGTGWDVVGLDVSAGMLATAAHRLAGPVAAGKVVLRQAEMTTFDLGGRQVAACVALEGALNHLLSEDALRRCFERVAAVLPAGGAFVFDLYEPHHFRGWHHISVIDEADAVVVKRGVWDDDRSVGMLRICGLFDGGAGPVRVNQTVTSHGYRTGTVAALLAAAGFDLAPFVAPVPDCACGRSGSGACRTVYAATRTG
jgi:SAM-dependent methyltransferase